jgi:hypothetical protein
MEAKLSEAFDDWWDGLGPGGVQRKPAVAA